MLKRICDLRLRAALGAGLVATGLLLSVPAAAQIQTIDPNSAIDGDLSHQQPSSASTATPASTAAASGETYGAPSSRYNGATPSQSAELPPTGNTSPPASAPAPAPVASATPVPTASASPQAAASQASSADATTYSQDDLIGAADGLFGKSAKGLAMLIQKILSDHGRPNAYIVGREAGGAFVFGLRYGSGTLYHKVEGDMPIYWTGPSIGFDAGADAGKTFILVYNLYDTEKLFSRFPAGEGAAYMVGGFNASYVRKGKIVLIPIRVGAGLRLGVNAGYLKFSHHQKWLPF